MTMMSQCIISLGRVLNFVRHSFNELFLYHIWIRGGWIRWGGYEGGGFEGNVSAYIASYQVSKIYTEIVILH